MRYWSCLSSGELVRMGSIAGPSASEQANFPFPVGAEVLTTWLAPIHRSRVVLLARNRCHSVAVERWSCGDRGRCTRARRPWCHGTRSDKCGHRSRHVRSRHRAEPSRAFAGSGRFELTGVSLISVIYMDFNRRTPSAPHYSPVEYLYSTGKSINRELGIGLLPFATAAFSAGQVLMLQTTEACFADGRFRRGGLSSACIAAGGLLGILLTSSDSITPPDLSCSDRH